MLTQPAGPSRYVVLLVPEALGPAPDLAALRTDLTNATKIARVELCVASSVEPALVAVLDESHTPYQVLLAADALPWCGKAQATRMPPGSDIPALYDFAVAMADLVLTAADGTAGPFTKLVSDGKRPGLKLGQPWPAPLAPAQHLHHRLNPRRLHWRLCGWMFGRLEPLIVELAAFNWLGREKNGPAKSRERLRNLLSKPIFRDAYFAPDEWRSLNPDRSAVDSTCATVAEFETFDRAALHGAFIHRDVIWGIHLLGWLAVFAALAGEIFKPEHAAPDAGHFWNIVELASLGLIALCVWLSRWRGLQDSWTACRLGAEQLRIARMCLPLLVAPDVLHTMPPTETSKSDLQFQQALTETRRTVRDQGLPQLPAGTKFRQAAEWLELIVHDQAVYHMNNHRKLEHAETRLGYALFACFVVAVLGVFAHFASERSAGLLFLTAGAPAFAAAIHGAVTKLGIVHRAALSHAAARDLAPIAADLHRLRELPEGELDEADGWKSVRAAALEAARVMDRENTTWHGLVRREKDSLPA